jgi:acyl-CoA thioesterase
MKSADEVVNIMYEGDAFSQWLGIEREQIAPGQVRLSMIVREEMTNGFKIAHGGISYSLADSALAFAANGYGLQALSIETAISHQRPVKAGDRLVAEAKEISRGKQLARYEVQVRDQNEKMVAHFKGTVFINGQAW